jgi:uncharacterized protein (DUF1499 family)
MPEDYDPPMETYDDPDPPPPAEPMAEPVAPRRPFSRVALAAGALAMAVALLAMFAGLGARWGIWHFGTGFQMLQWAAYGGIALIVVSIIAAVRTRPGASRRGMVIALVALVVGIAVVYVPWSWRRMARSVPPIHDITTDLENPPEFVAVLPLRADAPNPAEYGGEEIAAQQRAAYPDIRPLVMDLPRERAFQRALDTARDMGWEIVAADADAGRIEATDRTFWFGFRDDVVIRVTPLEGRTLVDVRSVSRVGGSDVGTNAQRIRNYLEALER